MFQPDQILEATIDDTMAPAITNASDIRLSIVNTHFLLSGVIGIILPSALDNPTEPFLAPEDYTEPLYKFFKYTI